MTLTPAQTDCLETLRRLQGKARTLAIHANRVNPGNSRATQTGVVLGTLRAAGLVRRSEWNGKTFWEIAQ